LSLKGAKVEFELLNCQRLYEARERRRNRVQGFPRKVGIAQVFHLISAKKFLQNEDF
jgi:hypothetical protein